MRITKKISKSLGFAFPIFKTKAFEEMDDNDILSISLRAIEQEKTEQQNRLFHGLLGCFWRSGCSSFINDDEMRRHYKRIAGLINIRYETTLSKETKEILWKAIRILPLKSEEKSKVIDLLKGKIEFEKSWADVSKKSAKETIDHLLNDMELAGVPSSSESKKYEEIVRSIGQFYEEFVTSKRRLIN